MSSAPTSTVAPACSRCRTRRIVAAVVALVLGAAAGGSLRSSPVTAASSVIHVAPGGADTGDGSASSPVRSVERAVKLAESGDVVEIASGTYHESVQVYAKEVHLRAAPGADVVFDGTVPVTGWAPWTSDTWAADWSTQFERVGAPFTTADRPEAGWPEQFFLDGQQLVEVGSNAAVGPGTFFVNRSSGVVVIGDDPTGRLVEGSDLNWAIYLNRANGSSVEGITVRRYATQNQNMAAIRAYADDLTVRDVTVEHNARIGLSAIGNRITFENVRALDNGHLGIHGHHSTDLTMTDVVVERNNREGFDGTHSAGGIKVTTSSRLLIDGAVVRDNDGPGIWTDLDVVDSVIRSTVTTDNRRSGIEVELSERIIVVDNLAVANGEAGVWVLESSDVDVWHNTALSNVRDVWIEDGDRADLAGVTVGNNVLGGGAPGAQAILNVDDWTERRSGDDMRITLDGNRYWIDPSSSTTLISRWANWPARLSLSADLDAHRSATGDGDASDVVVATENPFARSSSDPRQPDSAPTGVAVPPRVVATAPHVVGRPAGVTGAASDVSDPVDTTDPGDSTGPGGSSSSDPPPTTTPPPPPTAPPPPTGPPATPTPSPSGPITSVGGSGATASERATNSGRTGSVPSATLRREQVIHDPTSGEAATAPTGRAAAETADSASDTPAPRQEDVDAQRSAATERSEDAAPPLGGWRTLTILITDSINSAAA